MKFPNVAGANLAGKHYDLPQDFEGQYNVAVIVYQRFQQDMVDSWLEWLNRQAQDYPELRCYELPALPRYGVIQRLFIDEGMRSGIRDRAVRARTITLYVDVTTFNTALNLPTIDTIYVLLIDKRGDVLWRADGARTAQKSETLSRLLTELHTPAA